jgi:hypothetical protein
MSAAAGMIGYSAAATSRRSPTDLLLPRFDSLHESLCRNGHVAARFEAPELLRVSVRIFVRRPSGSNDGVRLSGPRDTRPNGQDALALVLALAAGRGPLVELGTPRASGDVAIVGLGQIGGQAGRQTPEPGDVVADGGVSIRRHATLKERGIGFIDLGTRDHPPGVRHDSRVMAGGAEWGVARVEPVCHALAPESGGVHAGGPGTGPFVELVHNGIERGMTQAIVEGCALRRRHGTPLGLRSAVACWRNGSVSGGHPLGPVRSIAHARRDTRMGVIRRPHADG